MIIKIYIEGGERVAVYLLPTDYVFVLIGFRVHGFLRFCEFEANSKARINIRTD